VNSIPRDKKNDPNKIKSAMDKMKKDLKKGKVKDTKGREI